MAAKYALPDGFNFFTGNSRFRHCQRLVTAFDDDPGELQDFVRRAADVHGSSQWRMVVAPRRADLHDHQTAIG